MALSVPQRGDSRGYSSESRRASRDGQRLERVSVAGAVPWEGPSRGSQAWSWGWPCSPAKPGTSQAGNVAACLSRLLLPRAAWHKSLRPWSPQGELFVSSHWLVHLTTRWKAGAGQGSCPHARASCSSVKHSWCVGPLVVVRSVVHGSPPEEVRPSGNRSAEDAVRALNGHGQVGVRTCRAGLLRSIPDAALAAWPMLGASSCPGAVVEVTGSALECVLRRRPREMPSTAF